MTHDISIDSFQSRHIGPDPGERDDMLRVLAAPSLDALIDQTIPVRHPHARPLDLPAAESEAQYLRRLRRVAAGNRVARSYIGMGYYDCITPSVILRNVFENPGWYTPYTPYQAEIAQGRLESLLNFQTMVRDLTGMDIATASLLDEGTAAGRGDGDVPSRADEEGAGRSSERVPRRRTRAFRRRSTSCAAAPSRSISRSKLAIADVDDLSTRAFGLLVQYPDDRGEVARSRGRSSSARMPPACWSRSRRISWR